MAATRQRGVGPDEQHERVLDHAPPDQRAVGQRAGHERGVDPVLGQGRARRLVGDLRDLHAQLGVTREPRQHLGDDPRLDARGRTEAHRAGAAVAERLDVGPGCAESDEDVLEVAEDEPPGVGQRDRGSAAGALDQADVERPL